MFWRIGFSTASSLDSLLEKPNVTVEDVLDDTDLLQECKSQNSKLVEFLQQPRIIQRLLEHVVGTAEVAGDGSAEWEEKVRFKYPYMASEVLSSDIWAILDTILAHQDDLLKPFWNSILSANPSRAEPPLTHFTHPLLNGAAQQNDSSGSSSSSGIALNSTGKRTINAQENGPGRSVLAGYWAKVNGVFLDKKPLEMLAFIRSLPRSVDRFIAHLETPAVVDLLYRMIQLEEATPEAGTIEWFADNGLVGKLVDLLSPKHSADLHLTVSELFKAVIAFSAPSATNLAQNQSADAFGGGSAFGGVDSFASARAGGTNNRLVRELASEEQIRKMVHFMLDMGPEKSQTAEGEVKSDAPSSESEQDVEAAAADKLKDSASEAPKSSALLPLRPSDQPASETASLSSQHRLSDVNDEDFPPVHAPEVEISTETMTSSLVTCIGVLIELIRKNNSDYFEQHLFHTLRQYLIQRQQDFTQERRGQAFNAADTSLSQSSDSDDMHRRLSNNSFQDPSEDEQLEAMEQAMTDFPSKLGIVHLGPMLEVLCERLPEFQHLLMNPRSSNAPRKTTLGELAPLTFERYRITELYAELLHCSNMALLNRVTGNGPQYSDQGNLLGGVDGFQMLARTMGVPDDTEAADESMQEGAALASVTADLSMSTETEPTDKDENATSSTSDKAEPKQKVDEGRPTVLHVRGGTQHVRYESTTSDSVTSSNGTDDEVMREASTGGQSAEHTPTLLQTSPTLTQGDEEGGKGSITPTAPVVPETSVETTAATAETTETTSADESAPKNPDSPKAPASGPSEKSSITNVGDLLKQKFIDCNIVPSLLTLFFEFPWNNFLHNVVYDILQQFFNGRMDIGLNRQLTIDVFRNGRLTDKIVEGHKRNEESSRGPRRIRLGYMGHMNLIAEETVKLLERYQGDIATPVQDYVKQPDWDNFVNQSLRENREREAAPLAGGPPVSGRNLSLGASSAEDDDDGPHIMSDNTFASYLSSQMATGGSDDDDSDEEGSWLSAGVGSSGQRGGEFDDAFVPPSGTGIGASSDSQEDEWGPFADSHDTSESFSSAFSQETNLTPADWSRDFRRAFDEEDGDIETSAFGGNDSESATPTPTSPQNNVPFVDLFDPAAVRRSTEASSAAAAAALAANAEAGKATSLEVLTIPAPDAGSSQSGIRPRSRTSSMSSNSSSGSNAAAATDPTSPLGPGVSPDTELTSEGKLKRVIDGREVIAPLDEVAVAAASISSGSSTGGDTEDALGTVSA
ncbi:hypothetical protein A4X13_0g181 [Tilletia indica]|uniref:Uncharacterized protein n=1 Tax=Tilletia indica TaxID=43049 RepID=A0A177TTZ6_9BASI|nr:hypothetical protein A4X13_0g181 [Tilletia indica]